MYDVVCKLCLTDKYSFLRICGLFPERQLPHIVSRLPSICGVRYDIHHKENYFSSPCQTAIPSVQQVVFL